MGDILLELDSDFNVICADGAIKNILGRLFAEGEKLNFLELLTERGRGLIKSSAKTLNGANRLGPFTVSVGLKGQSKEQFAVFMAKLPTSTQKFYIVLSKPYRVGMKNEGGVHQQLEDNKVEFFSRLEGLFEDNPEAEKNMQVTVIDTGDGQDLDPEQAKDLEQYLKSYSIGGNHAAMLGDDKFAFVHEKEKSSGTKVDYAKEIKSATGFAIESATIDAATANLSEKDSMRAMIFSLQQFADESEGFAVSQIETNCSTLIGETTERVVAFRKVLADGAFTLVYQPIVYLKNGVTHHFEALTRFELPDIIKSQWEMIRFAEDVGLISDFDKAVLNRTIKKLRELLRSGKPPGIAVNVSGRSLSDPEFVLDLVATLKGNKDLKRYLFIEITESSLIQDLDMLSEALKEVRAEGFKVYLDDFGAGAAGFQYLKKLKVDALKIDGDYIKNALVSKEDRAFLRSMVTLCQDLGIVTVGEWVETKEHAELLTALGVDYGQGYYFGKPNVGLVTSAVPVAVKAVAS